MATLAQAEVWARQESWRHKQVMHVVVRGAEYFAASPKDVRDMGGEIVKTLDPIKRRAGAKVRSTAI